MNLGIGAVTVVFLTGIWQDQNGGTKVPERLGNKATDPALKSREIATSYGDPGDPDHPNLQIADKGE